MNTDLVIKNNDAAKTHDTKKLANGRVKKSYSANATAIERTIWFSFSE